METLVARARVEDVPRLAPLFDAYRGFYERPSDPELARRFLSERLSKGESVVFLADRGGRLIGFTQMYPSFSSLSAKRVFILNDLYVAPEARGTGAASELMAAATAFAAADGAAGMTLATARTNRRAQALYERLGWERDETYVHYDLTLEA